MTDRHKVYTKEVQTLKQMMEMNHQGHRVTLAMMITGTVIGRNAQLSAMSTATALLKYPTEDSFWGITNLHFQSKPKGSRLELIPERPRPNHSL